MKLKINDKEIELKYSIRAMLMFENMNERPFNPNGLTDIVTFMYCVVVSSSKDYSISFDDFLDYLDANPNAMNDFASWLSKIEGTNKNLKKK